MNRAVMTGIGWLGLCASTAACSGDANPAEPPANGSTTGSTAAEPMNENVAPLPFADGWVAEATNSVGVQGSFYTFSDLTDGGVSTITPEDFSASGSLEICANGEAAQVLNGEFSTYWGAAVGFNLRQEEDDDAAYAWDAPLHGVTGFGFRVDELPVGGELRFNLKASGDENNYCARILAEGYNEFRFADLKKSCWTTEPGEPDYGSLEAVHWQFVTNESASYPFSLCISGLVALLG